ATTCRACTPSPRPSPAVRSRSARRRSADVVAGRRLVFRRLGHDVEPAGRVRGDRERFDPGAVEGWLTAAVELERDRGTGVEPDRGAPLAHAGVIAPGEQEALS